MPIPDVPQSTTEHYLESSDPELKQLAAEVAEMSEDERIDFASGLIVSLEERDDNWLKLAEASFAFWDNDEDAIYDNL